MFHGSSSTGRSFLAGFWVGFCEGRELAGAGLDEDAEVFGFGAAEVVGGGAGFPVTDFAGAGLLAAGAGFFAGATGGASGGSTASCSPQRGHCRVIVVDASRTRSLVRQPGHSTIW